MTDHDLDTAPLTCAALDLVVRPGGRLHCTLTEETEAARRIEQAIADGVPIYGVTTGLGSRATEMLTPDAIRGFSVETLNGRAHAVGDPLPRRLVRGAMAVRLASFMTGHSGASRDVILHLRDVYNAGLTPIVGGWGTIGAADLVLGATMGRAVIALGGRMERPDGSVQDAAAALSEARLPPPPLKPRDGLALANHACFSTAAAALALTDATRALDASIQVTALSFVGFQANLGPLGTATLGLRPQPGALDAAERLRRILDGAAICDPGAARRLQDPLSFRNWPQVFGVAIEQLDAAEATVGRELQGSSDNPAFTGDAFLSTGNYHVPHLTFAIEGLARALTGVAALTVARIAKLCTERLSGLPQYLADPEVGTNGFAPLLKVAESLLTGIQQNAYAPPPAPSLNADGVEDALTPALPAAQSLFRLIGLFDRLTALEALAAAQACDLRPVTPPPALRPAYDAIRHACPRIRESRPLGDAIETVAAAIQTDEGLTP